jgi:hypothetical protein
MPISIRFGVISIFLIKYEYIHILFFIKQFLFEFLSKNTKKLAAYYLAIPAGSVFSEQIFSETGCIVTSKRTSLTAEHVKQLIFLKKNWMILEK